MSKQFQARASHAAPAMHTPTRRNERVIAPPIAHDALRSHGQPLDAATRAFMEPRFGHDFSQVRVHTDEQAAQAAQSVNAVAYTVGRDVVFAAGRYTPHTAAGQRTLAHELAHVAQQGNVGSQSLSELAVGPTDDVYEREAERSASRIVAGSRRAPGNFTAAPPAIQRQPAPSKGEEDPSKKKFTTQPPPQNVPPEKVKEAAKEAEEKPEGAKFSLKAGGEVEASSKETSGGGKAEIEAEKEGVGSISGSIGGKRTSETTPEGGTEGSSSVEVAVEGKIPVGSWLLGSKDPKKDWNKKLAPIVVAKNVSVGGNLGFKRPDAVGRFATVLTGKLMVNVIGLEWEKLKVGKGLIDVGAQLSAVGEIEGAREDNKWAQPTIKVGGDVTGKAEYRPKAEGNLFIYVEGSATVTTTKEGGANFQPGALTWSAGAGVGFTFGGPEKKPKP